MSNLPPTKSALRRQAIEVRRTLAMQEASTSLCKRLATWPIFRESGQILLYHPLDGEISLLPLCREFPDKSWYLPRVISETELAFCRYQPGDPLEKHLFGMLEPPASAERFQADGGDVMVLVPGLMFDRSGHRLGYGKGFYDRFLSLHPSLLRVGVTPHCLWVEHSLPSEPWDVRMAYVATEEGIFAI